MVLVRVLMVMLVVVIMMVTLVIMLMTLLMVMMMSFSACTVQQMVHDTNQELMLELSVNSFPRFRFYLEGSQVDEIKGPNIQEVASKVRAI